MWRGLTGDEICSDYDDSGVFAVALADDPLQERRQLDKPFTPEQPEIDVAALAAFETASGSPEVVPVVVTDPEPDSTNGERLMIAGKRVWSASINADLYFVIGSFSNRNNARRMIAKYQELGPAVMASRLDGVEVYRVAVGPFTADQKRKMRRSLKLAGIGNAWAMRVDHQDWTLASPKSLSDPEQSVAEVPAQSPADTVAKPAAASVTSDELAETPEHPATEQEQSSEWIDNDRLHLVIGSFSKPDNARKFAKSKADLSPRILSVETTEGWRHRVVIGPYAKAQGLAVRDALANSGIDNIWALNLNPETIIDDTMMADVIDAPEPEAEQADVIFKNEIPAAASNQEMGWGVNLVEYIFDMFRSTETTEVVGVVASLEG